MKALVDIAGRAITSNFVSIRPKNTGYTLEFLWAVLNSPVSNAFAYTHLGKRHNLVKTIREIPFPGVQGNDIENVTRLVKRYQEFAGRSDLKVGSERTKVISDLLLRLDAEVIRLYKMPPPLERSLLYLFASWPRPGVPFEFDRYYPQHFAENISLQDLLAISIDWANTNKVRCKLIEKEVDETITEDEQLELERLQTLADYRIRLMAPLPIKELEEYHATLTAQDK